MVLNQDRLLRALLRIFGSTSALAILAVVMPYAWMDAVHRHLGLGALPAEPIVGYLARSTSAFYALLGGLLWVLSFDLRRHHVTLCYLGAAIVLFGLAILGVDLAEGLPLFWSLWEGPIDIAFGAAILWLALRRGVRHGGPPPAGPGSSGIPLATSPPV